jgi:nicotinate-nucleotide adenylyltransferase
MRIAVFGGSFSPPHIGHGLVAGWLRWTGKVDEVWLLPTFDHAFGKRCAPWSERLRWCHIAAAEVGPWVRVCEVESQLPTPSYTIDTLVHLERLHPDCSFRLVVGADILQETQDWKSWAEIAQRFSPIVVGRQGYPSAEGNIDFPGVSSTEIRRRLMAGKSVTHLLFSGIEDEVRAWWDQNQ